MELVQELVNIGPRPAGSEGAKRTAHWIADQCRAMGYTTRIDEWTESTYSGPMTFRNVVAKTPGEDNTQWILLGSHFDTKYLPNIPEFEGANDSASSTALLLEIMRAIRGADIPGGTGLEFVFFDGEECRVAYGPRDGLHGSKHHARGIREAGRTDAYRAMVLLDMIGDRDLRLTLSGDTPSDLAKTTFRLAEKLGVRDRVGYYPHGAILDDHRPFQKIGIPSINLIDFQFGPDNAYWHTADDSLDKLSTDSLHTVGKLALHLVWTLAEPPSR